MSAVNLTDEPRIPRGSFDAVEEHLEETTLSAASTGTA
jgi:hypothetical protein